MEDDSFNFDALSKYEFTKDNDFYAMNSVDEDNRSTGDIDINLFSSKINQDENPLNNSKLILFGPQLNEDNKSTKEKEILNSQKALSTFSISNPYIIENNTEESKPLARFKTIKPKMSEKEIKIKKVKTEKEHRKDYYLKLFKVRCGRYIIKTLNSYSKLHFYFPSSKGFTSNVNYEQNRKFLKMTIKEILLKYDKLTGGTNEKTIKKLEKKDKTKDDIRAIQRLLNKKYEEAIRDYMNDQQFIDDLNALETSNEKNAFYILGMDEQNNFINVMKTSKGNQKH